MADFQSIVYQMILSVLRDAQMTSASPGKTNTFKGLTNLGSSQIGLDAELRKAVEDVINEINGKGDPSEEKEKTLSGTNLPSTQIGLLDPKNAASTTAGATSKILAETPDVLMEVFRKLPPVAIAFLAASLAPAIFKYMTRPGSELDLRYIRKIEEEQNALLSRQQQHDTATGFRQVISTSTIDGFLAVNGANNENTSRQYRKGANFYGELFDITNADNAKGYYN